MIYLVYKSYKPGSAETNRALAYFGEIEKREIPVTVVYFTPDDRKSKISLPFTKLKFIYYWDSLPIRGLFFRYVFYYFNTLRFLCRLKKGDKVYLYGIDDIICRLLKKNNIRVFVEKTECPDVFLSDSRLHRLTVPQYIEEVKKCDGLFVISSNLKEYFEKKGVESSKIHIINMTVASERFAGVKKNISKSRNIVYCGSAMNTKDGLDDLLKAFKRLSDDYKDVTLLVVGAKPTPGMHNNPQLLVDEMGISERVHFTGSVMPDEMPQILKDATMLVLARPDNLQAKYGFPTKLGEYLLSANPVVVTSVGNITDFLTDGLDALIAPPNNPKVFADKMMWILEHPEESEAIGMNGRKVALKHFNAAIETDKLMRVLNP